MTTTPGFATGIADLDRVHERTAQYYGQKIARFGAEPHGVDWQCEATQHLRFVQLLRLCVAPRYSLNDVGCGYGALLGFLAQHRQLHRVDYLGIDVAPPMVAAARAKWPRHRKKFAVGAGSPRTADYSVASGIFNVRLDVPLALWERMVERTLVQLHGTSRSGFAVNFLTPVPFGVESPGELYRPGPGAWGAFCRREFGAEVQTLSAYGLHEETIVVRY